MDNHENDDQGMKDRFTEARRADEETAPSFQRMYRRAQAKAGEQDRPRRHLSHWAYTAALTVGAAAIALVLLVREPPRPQLTTAELVGWQSPTTALLRFPGTTVTGPTGRSALDSATPTADPISWRSPTAGFLIAK